MRCCISNRDKFPASFFRVGALAPPRARDNFEACCIRSHMDLEKYLIGLFTEKYQFSIYCATE